jgi:DNA-directed RNA polymerase subunit M/transcription elongation factor TFIIS
MDSNQSLYHYSNYDFIIDKSSDIKNSMIKYAENNLKRDESILKLANITKNITIATEIELGLFEYVLLYCINNFYENDVLIPIYEDKLYNILLNLDENERLQNDYLLNAILDKKINPRNIAFLSPKDLFPQKWNIYTKKLEYKKWREDNIDFTKTYKCPVCGECKSRVHQVQMRSADEPPTTFVICLVCKNSQKIE